MKTNFNEFIKEYGGPGRTIGFRYSNPTREYFFSVSFVFNSKLKKQYDMELIEGSIYETIEEILIDLKVEEDAMQLEWISKNKLLFSITMKAYSSLEFTAATIAILNKIKEDFEDDIEIIKDSINVDGPDITNEPIKKQIGFSIGKEKV